MQRWLQKAADWVGGTLFTWNCMSEKPSPLKWEDWPHRLVGWSALRFSCETIPGMA